MRTDSPSYVDLRSKVLLLVLLALCSPSQAEIPQDNTERPSIVCKDGSEAAKLLNQWYAAGLAAGNVDDWYDNRDRAHSQLPVAQFPQLSVHTYTEAEVKARQDWAAANRVHPKVVIGNSSTSAPPNAGGSNPRMLYNRGEIGFQLLEAQYRSNNVYIYPEHRDHDPNLGDLYQTNSPYMVISQGSSGSDRPFMDAFVKTSAAFRPDVKKVLVKSGLLMPTLQMLFRSTNKQVQSPDDYFTGIAHPSAFNGAQVDVLTMVMKANLMGLPDIPPLIQLKIDREASNAAAGTQVYAATPTVVACISRDRNATVKLTVSAQASVDILKQPLTFRWVVLRGDPERVHIKTREGGAIADLSVRHPMILPVPGNAAIKSSRVDIGVFASNGKAHSAPAFVTVSGLDKEGRTPKALANPNATPKPPKTNSPPWSPTLSLPALTDAKRWQIMLNRVNSSPRKFPATALFAHLTSAEQQFIRGIAQNSDGKNTELLTVRHSGTSKTLSAIVETGLTTLINDPSWFTNHQGKINKLLATDKTFKKSHYQKALKGMVDLSLLVPTLIQLKGTARRYKVATSAKGNGSPSQRLTKSERDQFRTFNLKLIDAVVFPGLLNFP